MHLKNGVGGGLGKKGVRCGEGGAQHQHHQAQGNFLNFDLPGQRVEGSKGKRQKARGHKANKKATVDNPLGAPPTCA